MGETSATGVAFTRDPSTGEKRFYGEYLINAQGEDVVAGIRTPQPITKLARKLKSAPTTCRWKRRCRKSSPSSSPSRRAREALPRHAGHRVHGRAGQALHAADPQRQAHRQGALRKIAVEMAKEGLITRKRRPARRSRQLDQLLHPTIDPKRARRHRERGLPASPGAAVGKIVFTRPRPSPRGAGQGHPRPRSRPARRHPRHARRQGILTTRGGMTSHAAVVARGMGRPASRRRRDRRSTPRAAIVKVGAPARSRRATSSRSTARRARCWSARCRWSSRSCRRLRRR
jgi:pyruvate,orthophosphate dikinase